MENLVLILLDLKKPYIGLLDNNQLIWQIFPVLLLIM